MEFCLMPQYTVHLQIGGIEIRTHNTHPLRTMIPNYVFPGLAFFFFFQCLPIFIYQCKCSDLDLLMSEIILILGIMSATFFSLQLLSPNQLLSFYLYMFLESNWQIPFKFQFCLSIQFASGPFNSFLVIHLVSHSAISPCNGSGNMVEFKGILIANEKLTISDNMYMFHFLTLKR